jgi:hypothetical protein
MAGFTYGLKPVPFAALSFPQLVKATLFWACFRGLRPPAPSVFFDANLWIKAGFLAQIADVEYTGLLRGGGQGVVECVGVFAGGNDYGQGAGEAG